MRRHERPVYVWLFALPMTKPKDTTRKCRRCEKHVHARREQPDLCRGCEAAERATRLGKPEAELADYKWCWGCGSAIGDYEKRNRNPHCRDCRNQRARERRKTYPSLTPVRRYEARLRQQFGITLSDYERMLADQGGACAICRSPSAGGRRNRAFGSNGKTRFAVDHDHDFNNVRGLLCSACNLGLGQFRDSPELLHSAIAYLRRNQPKLVEAS